MHNLFIGSWVSDGIVEAFEAVYTWLVGIVEGLLNRDISDWDIISVVTFANDSVRFLDSLFPLTTAIEILLVGFAAKLVVMLTKYIIGWIPGVDG